jgi:hypothetical protein
MSGEIRHVTKNMDREIADTIERGMPKMGKMAKAKDLKAQLANVAFWHIAHIQRLVNMATFEGARLRALDEGKSAEQSIQAADQVVRMTQSGAGLKDLAQIQRGGEFTKLITAFYTYFSVLYNRYHQSVSRVGLKPDSWPAFVNSMLWLTMAPVLIESLIKGDQPDDDEGWMQWYTMKNMEYMFVTLPGIRDAVRAFTSDYRVNATPALSVLSDLKNAGTTFNKMATEGYDWGDLTISQQRQMVNTVSKVMVVPNKPLVRGYEVWADDTVEDPVRHFLFGTGRD